MRLFSQIYIYIYFSMSFFNLCNSPIFIVLMMISVINVLKFQNVILQVRTENFGNCSCSNVSIRLFRLLKYKAHIFYILNTFKELLTDKTKYKKMPFNFLQHLLFRQLPSVFLPDGISRFNDSDRPLLSAGQTIEEPPLLTPIEC